METNSSYGQFYYKSNKRIDSLLSDSTGYKNISFDTLSKFLGRITKPSKPNWFPDESELKANPIYKKELMILIKADRDKKVYFIYSSEK